MVLQIIDIGLEEFPALPAGQRRDLGIGGRSEGLNQRIQGRPDAPESRTEPSFFLFVELGAQLVQVVFCQPRNYSAAKSGLTVPLTLRVEQRSDGVTVPACGLGAECNPESLRADRIRDRLLIASDCGTGDNLPIDGGETRILISP